MSQRLSARSSRGFTLIEVMISMAILAVLAVLTTQTMRAGIQDRETVSSDLSRESKVADALRIIRNDVNSAYHYRDIFVTIMNNAAKPEEKTPAENKPSDDSQPPPIVAPAPVAPVSNEPAATPRPTPAVVTGFIGDGESMYFTTLSNTRTMQDSQQSDQAKVGYFIKGCHARSGQKFVQSKCLYRSVSPYLDEEIEKPGDETVLLEHVEQFKLRYLGPGHDDLEFVDAWKTGKLGDANTKENFPYAVEVTLSTEDRNNKADKRVVGSALIPIRFPNNGPKKKEGAPGTTDANGTSDFNKGIKPPPKGGL